MWSELISKINTSYVLQYLVGTTVGICVGLLVGVTLGENDGVDSRSDKGLAVGMVDGADDGELIMSFDIKTWYITSTYGIILIDHMLICREYI